MIFLELFSGLGHLSDAVERRGHSVFRVDWNDKLRADLHADISKLSADDLIELCGGVPDVIWASPDCTTYSVAAIYRHRSKINDVSVPKTEYAAYCDYVNMHLWALIKELLQRGTKIFYVENPRGGYRKMHFIPEWATRHTVTYCQYGAPNMKPTDIFTNHPSPEFLETCNNGDPCHDSARRGSKGGTQGVGFWNRKHGAPTRALARGTMPQRLCEHIATISEIG